MRQHLFALFEPKCSFYLFYFRKKANFNKPFPQKGLLAGFSFGLSESYDEVYLCYTRSPAGCSGRLHLPSRDTDIAGTPYPL